MKAIIDNKIYDTDKADKIFSYQHKNSAPTIIKNLYYNFWENADIYKTKKGNYFTYFSNTEGYKEKFRIETVSEEQVKLLIAQLDPVTFIKIFGELEEG